MIFELEKIQKNSFLELNANLIPASIILITIIAASTSFGTDMYDAGYLNLASSGVKNATETSISKESNFISNGDIDIISNNNINILGSILASKNGNISLSATGTTDANGNKIGGNINIEAGTNTLSQTSKQETIYGGGSVGNNGVQLNIGMSQGESNYNKTFYTNSQISAENGSLILTTDKDANISGANLLAKNTILNIAGNLNVESKQTEEDYSSNGFGFNFGVGIGSGGNGGNVGGGFNISNADMHRLWTDNITTIKATDSMAVNVGKDLNLTGAAILSDNLALAVSGNTNKKELQDSYYRESMGFGFSRNFTTNGSQPTIPGTGGQPNATPGGSTTISGNYSQNESSRTVYATIGNLDSTLTSSTKNVTGGDFEGSLTVDHRLLSEAGRRDIGRQLNYSRFLVQAPVEDGIKLMKSDQEDKVNKFGSILATDTVATTRLFLNKDITAQQLAGDKEVVSYNGDSLDADPRAKGLTAFYDHSEGIAAINTSKTDGLSNKELVSIVGHEAIGHGIGGRSEYVADNTQSHINRIWDSFQSDNNNFQLSVPQPTILTNNYVNSITGNSDISSFAPVLIPAAYEGALALGTALAAAYGIKNTADILKNNNNSSSSSNQNISGGASAAGGMPDPDDEDKNNFKEADKKYYKHQNEFGNITKEQYEARANNLASSKADDNILSFTRNNGDVIKYNQNTNEFTSLSKDGNIRTFFKPSKGIEYWEQQIKFK